MAPIETEELDSKRGRLLAFVFLILAAFAGLSVVFTFVGADFLTPLQLTPGAARWGVLVLTMGFIALVWEKERQLRSWDHVITRQRLLLAGFENRLRVVEGLLQTSDRLNSPLALDDVLSVVLEAAVELVGAQGGCVDFLEDGSGDLSLAISHKSAQNGFDRERCVSLPLVDDDVPIGWLNLTPADGATGFDDVTTETLERFTSQASGALHKARVIARERAATAYREAVHIVKSRFLATLSHELRTPLTSVLGFSMTLGHHWDRLEEREKREFVGEVEKQASRMAELLDQLLEAGRAEIEGVAVNPEPHDVRRSIRRALFPFLTAGSSIRLVVRLPEEELRADVDPFVIDQVVSNLVDNALRYTQGKVRVNAHFEGDSLCLTVADEGPGVRGRKLQEALDPLWWEHDARGEETGLGLHIIGTFVNSHGGSLEAASEDSGTAISVWLPRYRGSRIRQV